MIKKSADLTAKDNSSIPGRGSVFRFLRYGIWTWTPALLILPQFHKKNKYHTTFYQQYGKMKTNSPKPKKSILTLNYVDQGKESTGRNCKEITRKIISQTMLCRVLSGGVPLPEALVRVFAALAAGYRSHRWIPGWQWGRQSFKLGWRVGKKNTRSRTEEVWWSHNHAVVDGGIYS